MFTDFEYLIAYTFLSHLASFVKLLDEGLPWPVQGQDTCDYVVITEIVLGTILEYYNPLID